MSDKKRPTEATQLLKTMPTELLAVLTRIQRDQAMYDALRLIFDSLLKDSQKKIIDSAGGVTSMDAMIDNSNNQSFYRGRISIAVLLNALIKNASDYLEKRSDGQTMGKPGSVAK